MTTPEIQLPKVVQTRISRLAHASGRSPAAMLRFVLRDGFDANFKKSGVNCLVLYN